MPVSLSATLMELLAIRLVKRLMKPLAIWLSCKKRSKPLVIAIPLSPKVRGKRLVISPQAGKSPVISRKRGERSEGGGAGQTIRYASFWVEAE